MSEIQVDVQEVIAELQAQFPREFTIAVQSVRIKKLEQAVAEANKPATAEA